MYIVILWVIKYKAYHFKNEIIIVAIYFDHKISYLEKDCYAVESCARWGGKSPDEGAEKG